MTRSSCLVDLLVLGIYRLRVSQEDVDGVHIASRKGIQRPAQHRLHARAEAVNIGYWFAQVVFDGEAVGPGHLSAVFPALAPAPRRSQPWPRHGGDRRPGAAGWQ